MSMTTSMQYVIIIITNINMLLHTIAMRIESYNLISLSLSLQSECIILLKYTHLDLQTYKYIYMNKVPDSTFHDVVL